MYGHFQDARVDGDDVFCPEWLWDDGHVRQRAGLAEVGCADAALEFADDAGED